MRTGPFVLLLVVLAAAGFWIYRSQTAALAAAQAALWQKTASQLPADGIEEASSHPPQSSPSPELLRLRGEVGVLRRELADADPDEIARRQHSNDWQLVYSGPRPSEHPDFIYFALLKPAGFATPEDSLQSFYHAMGHQRAEPFNDTRMKQLWDVPDDFDQPPGYNLHVGEGHYGGSGFRIVRREMLSTNSVRLTIDYEKEDGSSYRRDKILVERDGRWRMKPAGVTRATPSELPVPAAETRN